MIESSIKADEVVDLKKRIEELEGKLRERYQGECHAPDCQEPKIGFSKYCPEHFMGTANLEALTAVVDAVLKADKIGGYSMKSIIALAKKVALDKEGGKK